MSILNLCATSSQSAQTLPKFGSAAAMDRVFRGQTPCPRHAAPNVNAPGSEPVTFQIPLAGRDLVLSPCLSAGMALP